MIYLSPIILLPSKIKAKNFETQNEIIKWLLIIATNEEEKIVAVQHEVIMCFVPPPTSG